MRTSSLSDILEDLTAIQNDMFELNDGEDLLEFNNFDDLCDRVSLTVSNLAECIRTLKELL